MPVVDVTIGNRTFQISCGDGQEGHLIGLSEQVSEKFKEISVSFEGANDSFLLAVTSLMMQDEFNELKEHAPAEGVKEESGKKLAKNTGITEEEVNERIDEAVIEAITAISEYVETVADRVEKG